jgi:hypothetical protein
MPITHSTKDNDLEINLETEVVKFINGQESQVFHEVGWRAYQNSLRREMENPLGVTSLASNTL